ncbi:MAG: hypothetical protein FIB05_10295 [Betaproteobacteria bacterium]|nr:hypothetical protein [Betaproteobacteria bacterium]PWB57403.1 MAG: hypothetical protein C3F16_15485 [Betaproteobacteria bacterium]
MDLPALLRHAIAAAFVLAAAALPARAAEPRVALVIGNAAYPAAPLRNPVNDANAIAARLRAMGFEVTLRTDVTQREFTRAVSQFGQALKPGSVALFYYAGHGMQVRGRNFLVPVDADIQSEASARSESVDLDLVLEQLGPARLSMVILDACRNNPFEGKFRSTRGSGLAQVDAPKGTLLAYATAPGKVASDGDGANGLYTAELLRAMQVPGAKVEEVFKAVRVNVIKATAGEQVPWESSSLTGDYYFSPAPARAEGAKAARDAGVPQAELQAKLDAERQAREKEAQALKAEMEKLREEVRRLSVAAAPASTQPAAAAKAPAPATQASAEKPPSATAKRTDAPKKIDGDKRVEEAKKPQDRPAPSGTKLAALEKKGAAAPSGLSSPPSPKLREAVSEEWQRRLAVLESERGRLTMAKAAAILFAPLNDQQLTILVEKERSLRNLPYNTAFALGHDAAGGTRSWLTWNESTPGLAEETARNRCTQNSTARCAVVMVNGEFREAEFVAWARGADGGNLGRMRVAFLRTRTGR